MYQIQNSWVAFSRVHGSAPRSPRCFYDPVCIINLWYFLFRARCFWRNMIWGPLWWAWSSTRLSKWLIRNVVVAHTTLKMWTCGQIIGNLPTLPDLLPSANSANAYGQGHVTLKIDFWKVRYLASKIDDSAVLSKVILTAFQTTFFCHDVILGLIEDRFLSKF
jgi:hypothetical protein